MHKYISIISVNIFCEAPMSTVASACLSDVRPPRGLFDAIFYLMCRECCYCNMELMQRPSLIGGIFCFLFQPHYDPCCDWLLRCI